VVNAAGTSGYVKYVVGASCADILGIAKKNVIAIEIITFLIVCKFGTPFETIKSAGLFSKSNEKIINKQLIL